ncbi:MAG: hypothetical protein ORN58_03305 [Sediminibacterium sp.]|nr:hypothetical protein [Sediminibacterium sp.]
MAKQIIIALCEGPHDVSFINRILKTAGFISNEKMKLNQFPTPMNKLMASEFSKTDVEQLNLQELRKGVLPTHTLQKEDNWVFLYSIDGDSKKKVRITIINNLKANIRQAGEIKGDRGNVDTQFSVVYIFDADYKGVAARLAEVLNEVKEVFTTLTANIFPANSTFATVEKIKIGCHIITGADNNTGKLEDILMPLMKSGNEVIFDNAETYLDTNFDQTRTFPLKLSIANNVVTEKRSEKKRDTDFDIQKSIIGITGQVQRSGKSNTTYISDTDYLTLDKINTNKKCQDIINFFNNFVNNL